jgi:hypothetical protein
LKPRRYLKPLLKAVSNSGRPNSGVVSNTVVTGLLEYVKKAKIYESQNQNFDVGLSKTKTSFSDTVACFVDDDLSALRLTTAR